MTSTTKSNYSLLNLSDTKQKKYMIGRFGLFKTHILLMLYRNNFNKTLKNYINNVNHNVNQRDRTNRIENIKKVYNYIYNNLDICYSRYMISLNPDFIELIKKNFLNFLVQNHKILCPY